MSLPIDYNVNSWLEGIDLEENKEHLNRILKLGSEVSKLSQISFNPESSIFEPINYKITSINENCNNTYQQMLGNLDIYKANIEHIQDKLTHIDNNINILHRRRTSTFFLFFLPT